MIPALSLLANSGDYPWPAQYPAWLPATATPPPFRRTPVAHLVHWQCLLAEWDAEHERKQHADALEEFTLYDPSNPPWGAL